MLRRILGTVELTFTLGAGLVPAVLLISSGNLGSASPAAGRSPHPSGDISRGPIPEPGQNLNSDRPAQRRNPTGQVAVR